jgi:homoserine kinase type II
LLLITTAGSAVVKYYEKRTLDYVNFEVELLHYLAQNSYPCSSPVVNRQGEHVRLYKKKPLALFVFLEGKHSESPENCLQVAKVIGQLHALTIGYKPGNAEDRAAYDPDYCWSCAKESAKSSNSDAKAQERLTWVKSELNKLELPDSLPKGVCHGDVNPTNFLYLHRKLSAVLDFDQASYTWLLYDVAQLVY